ncbi:unnamed protein product [Amoebophrya sp. A120]|nr:unnamed protein product [Amoebophrya sp. A120]|eukprot:GSA120T00019874001.1
MFHPFAVFLNGLWEDPATATHDPVHARFQKQSDKAGFETKRVSRYLTWRYSYLLCGVPLFYFIKIILDFAVVKSGHHHDLATILERDLPGSTGGGPSGFGAKIAKNLEKFVTVLVVDEWILFAVNLVSFLGTCFAIVLGFGPSFLLAESPKKGEYKESKDEQKDDDGPPAASALRSRGQHLLDQNPEGSSALKLVSGLSVASHGSITRPSAAGGAAIVVQEQDQRDVDQDYDTTITLTATGAKLAAGAAGNSTTSSFLRLSPSNKQNSKTFDLKTKKWNTVVPADSKDETNASALADRNAPAGAEHHHDVDPSIDHGQALTGTFLASLGKSASKFKSLSARAKRSAAAKRSTPRGHDHDDYEDHLFHHGSCTSDESSKQDHDAHVTKQREDGEQEDKLHALIHQSLMTSANYKDLPGRRTRNIEGGNNVNIKAAGSVKRKGTADREDHSGFNIEGEHIAAFQSSSQSGSSSSSSSSCSGNNYDYLEQQDEDQDLSSFLIRPSFSGSESGQHVITARVASTFSSGQSSANMTFRTNDGRPTTAAAPGAAAALPTAFGPGRSDFYIGTPERLFEESDQSVVDEVVEVVLDEEPQCRVTRTSDNLRIQPAFMFSRRTSAVEEPGPAAVDYNFYSRRTTTDKNPFHFYDEETSDVNLPPNPSGPHAAAAAGVSEQTDVSEYNFPVAATTTAAAPPSSQHRQGNMTPNLKSDLILPPQSGHDLRSAPQSYDASILASNRGMHGFILSSTENSRAGGGTTYPETIAPPGGGPRADVLGGEAGAPGTIAPDSSSHRGIISGLVQSQRQGTQDVEVDHAQQQSLAHIAAEQDGNVTTTGVTTSPDGRADGEHQDPGGPPGGDHRTTASNKQEKYRKSLLKLTWYSQVILWISWALQIGIPLLLYLAIPFRSFIDRNGMDIVLCEQGLTQLFHTPIFARANLNHTLVLAENLGYLKQAQEEKNEKIDVENKSNARFDLLGTNSLWLRDLPAREKSAQEGVEVPAVATNPFSALTVHVEEAQNNWCTYHGSRWLDAFDNIKLDCALTLSAVCITELCIHDRTTSTSSNKIGSTTSSAASSSSLDDPIALFADAVGVERTTSSIPIPAELTTAYEQCFEQTSTGLSEISNSAGNQCLDYTNPVMFEAAMNYMQVCVALGYAEKEEVQLAQGYSEAGKSPNITIHLNPIPPGSTPAHRSVEEDLSLAPSTGDTSGPVVPSTRYHRGLHGKGEDPVAGGKGADTSTGSSRRNNISPQAPPPTSAPLQESAGLPPYLSPPAGKGGWLGDLTGGRGMAVPKVVLGENHEASEQGDKASPVEVSEKRATNKNSVRSSTRGSSSGGENDTDAVSGSSGVGVAEEADVVVAPVLENELLLAPSHQVAAGRPNEKTTKNVEEPLAQQAQLALAGNDKAEGEKAEDKIDDAEAQAPATAASSLSRHSNLKSKRTYLRHSNNARHRTKIEEPVEDVAVLLPTSVPEEVHPADAEGAQAGTTAFLEIKARDAASNRTRTTHGADADSRPDRESSEQVQSLDLIPTWLLPPHFVSRGTIRQATLAFRATLEKGDFPTTRSKVDRQAESIVSTMMKFTEVPDKTVPTTEEIEQMEMSIRKNAELKADELILAVEKEVERVDRLLNAEQHNNPESLVLPPSAQELYSPLGRKLKRTTAKKLSTPSTIAATGSSVEEGRTTTELGNVVEDSEDRLLGSSLSLHSAPDEQPNAGVAVAAAVSPPPGGVADSSVDAGAGSTTSSTRMDEEGATSLGGGTTGPASTSPSSAPNGNENPEDVAGTTSSDQDKNLLRWIRAVNNHHAGRLEAEEQNQILSSSKSFLSKRQDFSASLGFLEHQQNSGKIQQTKTSKSPSLPGEIKEKQTQELQMHSRSIVKMNHDQEQNAKPAEPVTADSLSSGGLLGSSAENSVSTDHPLQQGLPVQSSSSRGGPQQNKTSLLHDADTPFVGLPAPSPNVVVFFKDEGTASGTSSSPGRTSMENKETTISTTNPAGDHLPTPLPLAKEEGNKVGHYVSQNSGKNENQREDHSTLHGDTTAGGRSNVNPTKNTNHVLLPSSSATGELQEDGAAASSSNTTDLHDPQFLTLEEKLAAYAEFAQREREQAIRNLEEDFHSAQKDIRRMKSAALWSLAQTETAITSSLSLAVAGTTFLSLLPIAVPLANGFAEALLNQKALFPGSQHGGYVLMLCVLILTITLYGCALALVQQATMGGDWVLTLILLLILSWIGATFATAGRFLKTMRSDKKGDDQESRWQGYKVVWVEYLVQTLILIALIAFSLYYIKRTMEDRLDLSAILANLTVQHFFSLTCDFIVKKTQTAVAMTDMMVYAYCKTEMWEMFYSTAASEKTARRLWKKEVREIGALMNVSLPDHVRKGINESNKGKGSRGEDGLSKNGSKQGEDSTARSSAAARAGTGSVTDAGQTQMKGDRLSVSGFENFLAISSSQGGDGENMTIGAEKMLKRGTNESSAATASTDASIDIAGVRKNQKRKNGYPNSKASVDNYDGTHVAADISHMASIAENVARKQQHDRGSFYDEDVVLNVNALSARGDHQQTLAIKQLKKQNTRDKVLKIQEPSSERPENDRAGGDP